jgi:hypothetical protein
MLMKLRFFFACALLCSTSLSSPMSFAAQVVQIKPQQELASGSAMFYIQVIQINLCLLRQLPS